MASEDSRLIDRAPFDQVILKGAKTIEVLPLDLPQRPLLAIPIEGKLRVRLFDRPTEDYEVSWSDVAAVRVYEQLLLEEARQLTAADKFDEAYGHFARLVAEYDSLPGLNDAVSDYLRRNALALYQTGEYDRALAVLITLQKRNPTYNGLANAVQTVAGEIIERYLREENYEAARGVLELWQRQFPGLATAAASDWEARFQAAATRQLDEAGRLVQQHQYIAARKSVTRAIGIWPEHEAATTMLARIKREFPFVTVGVFESAPRQPVRRIDNWAALRTSRLVQRMLVEQVDFGAEGGIYRSPFGEVELDDTGRELTLVLNSTVGTEAPRPRGLTPDAVSRYLLSMANPGSTAFRSDFARLLGGVSLAGNRVQLHYTRPHVRPEAFLQRPSSAVAGDAKATSVDGEFSIGDYSADQIVFAASDSRRGGEMPTLRAVVEENMPDDEAAMKALLAGEIDVLDRVPPWHVATLRGQNSVRVESYRLPTVHVLIPNHDRPLLARREFRRALCFGIDRKWIVERMLLGGTAMPGYEVLSGPFPVGLSLSDPVRYAYNSQITPRPFEPRLAAILATIAWAAVQNPAEETAAPSSEIPELVLAHAKDPVIETACQLIEAQLERAGIPIKRVEFSADDLIEGRLEYDLRYAELAVWEPVTDARLVVVPGGAAGDVSTPYLEAALLKLDDATNWKYVRSSLNELHEMAHHDLPVIPLWQTVNYFAYRASMGGLGQSPMTLYQNIGQWQIADGNEVARLNRGE